MVACKLIRRSALVVFFFATWLVPCLAADRDSASPHVRSNERRVRALLDAGCQRSATFRRLVDQIEDSDIIVYIESTPYLPPPVDAYVRFAAATPAHRYLRIVLEVQVNEDALIALLAHELQHINEVAASPEVRDNDTLAAFYKRVGDENADGFDSHAARSTGLVVREELRRSHAVANSQ